MDSDGSEGEEPLVKKVKSQCVIEDSEEEWEGIPDKGDWWKDSGEVAQTEDFREGTEEVQVSSVSEAKVQEEVREDKDKEKREAKKVRREARRSERKARRSERKARRSERKMRRLERSEEMKDSIYIVRGLGNKVDRFAEEVRVSNVLRNRADREYLEERRQWYFTDRLANARGLSEEDSEVYSA
jgi:hypothetical protein